jgi:cytochrome oxidase Cu insertion factor (SCO1/SenC/PrrC family)
MGIVLGTSAAMMTKVFRTRKAASSVPVDVTDEEDLYEEDIRPPAPPDPGRRATLASLVESAKKEDRWLKEFQFLDQNGETVTSESLRGQPYVACFFFTTCPGSCPRQSSQMQLLAKKLKNKPIRFVSITVDPEIDTPEMLAEYAKNFDADSSKWKFLNGPIDYTKKVGVEKFFLDGVEKRGHPDRFCLVNAAGDIIGSYLWMDIDERELLEKHIAEILPK